MLHHCRVARERHDNAKIALSCTPHDHHNDTDANKHHHAGADDHPHAGADEHPHAGADDHPHADMHGGDATGNRDVLSVECMLVSTVKWNDLRCNISGHVIATIGFLG